MRVGTVIGTVVATRKDSALVGRKLLVVRPDAIAGRRPAGQPFVAADSGVGAGIGDRVLVTEYSSARRAGGMSDTPVDAVIVGVIDTIEVSGQG